MIAKKKSNNSRKQVNEAEEEIDERFIAAVTRPQFQRPKEEKSKVVLDERFASVLTDPKFSLQTKDKYGRRIMKKSVVENSLKDFYTVEAKSGEEDFQDADGEGQKSLSENEDSDADEEVEVDDDQDKDPASRIAYLTALSRGEIDVSESSDDDGGSESNDDDSDSDNEMAVLGKAGILDPSTAKEEELTLTNVPSPFMAILNMDWAHVRAVDIFAILSSFTSPGSIRKVQVYPSDYGLERMEKEKSHGPVDIWKKVKQANVDADNVYEGVDKEADDIDSEEYDDEDNASEDSDANDRKRAPAIKFELDDEDLHPAFDPEKLRAYEASKLKYFFAVVEFASPGVADAAYKEVDGLELEHSSASIDMRSIDPDQLKGVVQDRDLRDEASTIPSNYKPPEFVVSALQQTNVACTWDEGDAERERKLTKYKSSQGWNEIADDENLRAYIASDHSSDDESDDDPDPASSRKGSNLRKMLGLESGDEIEQSDNIPGDDTSKENQDSGDDGERQVSFIPGKASLVEKISQKVGQAQNEEISPWQKYLEKRKQKRREKRQARRTGGKSHDNEDDSEKEQDFDDDDDDDDDFFVDDEGIENRQDKKSSQKKREKKASSMDSADDDRRPSTKEELQLLVAGDEGDDDALDYDMRGLVRMDKLKGQKLKGARKRKQEKLASNVSGAEFKIDTKDSRFGAVFQGDNDLFGIDRTDRNYRETEAMRQILAEQNTQRKAMKRAKKEPVAPNVNAEAAVEKSGGASALSSLVKSLKSKVAKTTKL